MTTLFRDHNTLARVGIYSYGLKSPQPPETLYEIDVSNLRDPQGQKNLRSLDGRDSQVQAWVLGDSRSAAIISNVSLIVTDLTRRVNWFTIGVRDVHGKYTAPAMAESIAASLVACGIDVIVRHYGLE